MKLRKIIESEYGPIFLLIVIILTFGLCIYFIVKNVKDEKKERNKKEYFKLSPYQKIKADSLSLIQNDPKTVIKHWTPAYIFICGLYLVCELLERIHIGMYVDVVKFIILIVLVASLALAFGIGSLLQGLVGNDTEEIEGLVIYQMDCSTKYSKGYKFAVEYKLGTREFTYYSKCKYSKCSCPLAGTQYDLIYSRKYDKVISKDDIRRYRKHSFYGFGGLLFFALLVGARFL